MPEIVSGSQVYGRDMPPAVSDQEWTGQYNITSTTYITGDPEMGVNFTAPTSGRVLIAIGCGLRNNSSANDDRTIVSYVLYEDSSNGSIVSPAAADQGVMMNGTAVASEFHYTGGFNMEEGLDPGRNYYVQVVFRSTSGSGTADVASRDITVIPLT